MSAESAALVAVHRGRSCCCDDVLVALVEMTAAAEINKAALDRLSAADRAFVERAQTITEAAR